MTSSAGRSGRRWIKLKAEVKARARAGQPCCRCGQRIDTSLEYPHPDSCSTDHYPHPLATHPWLAEEPTNLAPAHLQCNQSAGARGVTPPLGSTSEDW